MGSKSDWRKIDLADADMAYADRLVEAGAYASVGQVLAAGLAALKERDEVEAWLRNEVLPVHDKMAADPSRALSTDEASARLDERHETRLKTRR